MFDLELPDLTAARGEALVLACTEQAAWPVVFIPGRVERRWFGVEKAFPPVVEIATEDAEGPILAAAAARDAEAIALRPETLDALARTMVVIAAHFPAGFVFRATWAGSPILQDESLTVGGLARRVRASGLNEFTRYRVSVG